MATSTSRCIGATVALAMGSLTGISTAAAEDYPVRPVRIIIGFGPGASGDIAARVLAQKFGMLFGQQFVVENRTGAGSNIATNFVAHAPKDGYTLLQGTVANTINAATAPNLNFDLMKDFAPVALFTTLPNILVVHPAIGAKTVNDLIGIARATPGQFSFGSAGVGSGSHFTGELFNVLAGTKLVHVPDLPTVSEAGIPGFDTSGWFGLLAPAGVSRDVIESLARATNEAAKAPDVVAALRPQGFDMEGGTAAEFATFIRSDLEKWSRVATAAGLKRYVVDRFSESGGIETSIKVITLEDRKRRPPTLSAVGATLVVARSVRRKQGDHKGRPYIFLMPRK